MRVCQAFVREWGALENPKFGSYYDLCQQPKRQIRKKTFKHACHQRRWNLANVSFFTWKTPVKCIWSRIGTWGIRNARIVNSKHQFFSDEIHSKYGFFRFTTHFHDFWKVFPIRNRDWSFAQEVQQRASKSEVKTWAWAGKLWLGLCDMYNVFYRLLSTSYFRKLVY